MFTYSSLHRYVYLFLLFVHIPCCCTMCTYFTFLHYVILFHPDALCLRILRHCTIFSSPKLLHCVFLFHCCTMSSLSNAHADALCLLYFCRHLPCCCSMCTCVMFLCYVSLLHYVYLFHTADCIFFTMLLHNVYLIHTSSLSLPIPCCCTMSTY